MYQQDARLLGKLRFARSLSLFVIKRGHGLAILVLSANAKGNKIAVDQAMAVVAPLVIVVVAKEPGTVGELGINLAKKVLNGIVIELPVALSTPFPTRVTPAPWYQAPLRLKQLRDPKR